MISSLKTKLIFLIKLPFLCLALSLFPLTALTKMDEPIIHKIHIEGASRFEESTIKNKLPWQEGQPLQLHSSNTAIHNIYSLKHFSDIKLYSEKNDDGTVDLFVVLTEKPLLKDFLIIHNSALSTKDIDKKLGLSLLPAADEKELEHKARCLEALYREKGFYNAKVTLETVKEDTGIHATFKVEEGKKALVKKVEFKGAYAFTHKKLRSILFTREDWILGPLSGAGKYIPQAIDADIYTLESFYHNHGYLHARVTAHDMVLDDHKNITITFTIYEGDLYTIEEVKAPGNDIHTEKELLYFLPLQRGSLYSKELIRMSIERLKTIWGEKGYIYADVSPAIEPNEENKTVKVTFYSDLGKQVHLSRINIFGNNKTYDKIIRRMCVMEEGSLLKLSQLEHSKELIKGLGYFDPRDGVNWKINRISDTHADVDFKVKEVSTGRGETKLTFGGSPNNLSSSNGGWAGEIQISERNMFGLGIMNHLNLRYGQEDQSISAGITQPWLFDKPIRAGVNGYFSHNEYDAIKKVVNALEEKRGGGAFNIGYVFQRYDNVRFNAELGFDHFRLYSKSTDGTKDVAPQASIIGDDTVKAELQSIYDARFKSGKFVFLQADFSQDTRNHYAHISRGYKWVTTARFGLPTAGDTFAFAKLQFDGHWYTPLINETDLVLHLHSHLGIVAARSKHTIPYKELYHIGGPNSVRGWQFGQISPLWYHPSLLDDRNEWLGDSLGAKKAFFLNAELIFPITNDLSVKGVLFYDGGSGWDTPRNTLIPDDHLRNNGFDYRHCIGFGIRMLQPQPIRFDWAIKLDKRTGERATEVSFSSYYDF